MIRRDAATERQVQAADPRGSVWLSANAGSGKTRVLTDRVARLLLDGVDPQNILCLTYTKAAASEMQNRLFRRLGGWAMMARDKLTAELQLLGVDGTIDAARIAEARRLFARAIETPGGLKIQTIHSFCGGLLRRFPLEARVSPQFAEMDDRAAELLRAEVVDTMAAGADVHLVDGIARLFTGDDFDTLLAAISGRSGAFAAMPDDDRLRATVGAPPGLTLDRLLAALFDADDMAAIGRLADVCATGSSTDVTASNRLRPIGKSPPVSAADLVALEGVFLTGEGSRSPFCAKIGSFPTKALRASHPELMEHVEDLMARVEAARQDRLALMALERTRALYAFGCRFVPLYEQAKLRRGMLDFDDLIGKARALLTDPAVAAWVLFRLDGGIDHILVDEAQDTSPDQWAVIERLAQEFAAGQGARADRLRTIFVVGDKKQSIYSFQGADPDEFDRMQAHFDSRLTASGEGLTSLDLEFSFRSAEPILRVVDNTFFGPNREGLGHPVPHRAFKHRMPGRVDLWPAIAPVKEDKSDRDWTDPVDQVSARHHSTQLAERIAAEIVRMKQTETVPAEKGHSGDFERRKVTEGDILILVQRRSDLFAEIIRACKAAGLQVAGADRLRIGGELAVRDIAALLRFLALPEDDLSLAAALKSPLFGWTEQQLFSLAHPRAKGVWLWQALRDAAANHPDTMAILDDLRTQADFLRPYDLINRILTRHDGRRRLLARLGAEAEDGIDALLAQALAYEQGAVPGLTAFVEWMATDDLQIKRQMDSQGDRIRVMTVHGAKGLEAPIVFLPDATKRPVRMNDALYPADDLVVWAMAKPEMPAPVLALREGLVAAQERERRRLLYVAMTRAESWLIVCAAGDVGTGGDSWHAMVAEGMERSGASHHDFSGEAGLRLDHPDWDGLPLRHEATTSQIDPVAPQFDIVEMPAVIRGTLSPSDLGGAKVLPGDPAEGDLDAALARGRLVHLLLEHLPGVAPAERADFGLRLLQGAEDAPGVTDTQTLVADAAGMIGAAGLAEVFGAEAMTEVDVTAAVPALGGLRLHGAIDRLIVGADRILAVDFKTNRLVPATPDMVPEGLLRQMGAYRAMLAEIWPLHRIEVAILWTATATLMPLPAQDIEAALRRATLP